ncbi:putative methyltransferase MT3445 [Diplonema papillatum]|nr:putative methyltransferase MT3445 [Diplonema papillatum]|eukprot:gene2494-3868_t
MAGSAKASWAERAKSFDGAVDAYERARPTYSAEAAQWAVPGGARRVLDLGAGTGKFTTQLVDLRLDVVAVEPLPLMREQLRKGLPSVRALEGTAEEIPLPDASVDAVFVAEAWHWFNPDRAAAEISRVLAPGGRLCIVYNERDTSHPWVAILNDLMGPPDHGYTPDVPPPFVEQERAVFPWRYAMTKPAILDLAASRSSFITRPPAERAAALAKIREFLDTHPDLAGRDEVSFPYLTKCTRAKLPTP